jgi:7-cyano-7-deazaguanine reductase
MTTKPSRELETFENPHPSRPYEVRFDCPEFTCVCPLTGQPDFAKIQIRYVPAARCVELKSLKLYLWSYREEGAFHEDITNRIAGDLIDATEPQFLEIEAEFFVRGGITTTVVVRHGEEPGR